MRRTKWHQNYPIWKLFWVIETKSLIHGFRFNNPKQFLNWIILVSFCSSHRVVKNGYDVHCMKFKKSLQKLIFPPKIQKVCVLQRKHEQFQTQLSRKLQRFRTCRKNKKCPIFHELSEYQQNGNFFSTRLVL